MCTHILDKNIATTYSSRVDIITAFDFIDIIKTDKKNKGLQENEVNNNAHLGQSKLHLLKLALVALNTSCLGS